MKISVKDLGNHEVRKVDVPDEVFGYPYNEHLIHLAVEAYRAAQRSGSHHAKTRAEVSGSGRKLWRQKGTGRARVGDIRNPKWRKGGIVHGPRPRSHENGLTPREKRNALKSALSRRLATENVVVVESLDLDSHKTKELVNHLRGLGIDDKVLLVDSRDNENLGLASRNHPKVKTVDALGVNVYDVVDRPWIVVSESALERIVEVLSK